MLNYRTKFLPESIKRGLLRPGDGKVRGFKIATNVFGSQQICLDENSVNFPSSHPIAPRVGW